MRAANVAATIAAALQGLADPATTGALQARQKLQLLDQLCSVRAQLDARPLNEFVDPVMLAKRLRPLCADPIQTIRAATLRTLRVYAVSPLAVSAFLTAKLHVFLMRSLERDAKHKVERIQAMKLTRKLIDVDPNQFPRSLVASLVSLAEHPDDLFSRVALESLCELAVANTAVLQLGGGLRTIIAACMERRFDDLVEPLTLTVMHLFSHPKLRVYVDHEHGMGMLLSSFTETFTSQDADVDRKRDVARRAILTALRSWSGLVYFGSLPVVGMASIVKALHLDDSKIQQSLLHMLYQLFRIRPPRTTSSFQAALRLHSETLASRDSDFNLTSDRFNPADSYMAIMLVAFVHGQLIETLVELGCSDTRDVVVLVTILLGELLHMANRILPSALCAQLQTLPSLVSSAALFVNRDDRGMRSRANTLLSNLHEFARVRKLASEYNDFHMQLLLFNTYKTRRALGKDKETRTFNDHIKNLKQKMELRMDDAKLQALLKATEVYNGKDYTKWHWDLIMEVIEGPLSDSKRMEDCIAKTKFAKRILSFLRPTNHQFSDVKIDKRNKHKNLRYIRTACLLLEALMSSDEGARYLAENEFLGQITDFCREELTIGGAAGAAGDESAAGGGAAATGGADEFGERFLDKNRLIKTMTREYFTMLGVLSSSKRGQDLLEQKDIFNVLYPLSEGKTGRDDVAKLIVTSLDYNLEGHPRVLLAKAMTCKSKKIRYIATKHMRVLMRAGVNDFTNWGADLLVTQLSDPDKDISQAALKILVEACEDAETLAALISKQPLLTTLDGRGKDLLIKFLSLPAGVTYLQKHAWIAGEMEAWHSKGNIEYVNTLELAMARSLQPFLFPPLVQAGTPAQPAAAASTPSTPAGSGIAQTGFAGSGVVASIVAATAAAAGKVASAASQPVGGLQYSGSSNEAAEVDDSNATVLRPHFYGELAKTAEGCALLRASGHFDEFIRQIDDADAHVLFRKSALWAVAHIGSSVTGFEFVERSGVLARIVAMAERGDILSLKGTAFFAVGLLSSCERAAAALRAVNWEANGLKGICIPREASQFLGVAPYERAGLWPVSALNKFDRESMTPALQLLSCRPQDLAAAPAGPAGAVAAPALAPAPAPAPAGGVARSMGTTGAARSVAGAGAGVAARPAAGVSGAAPAGAAARPGAAADAAAVAAAAAAAASLDPDDPKNVPGLIVDALGKLSNHITADAASRELKRIKKDDALTAHFANAGVTCLALHLMQSYKFRQPARRFIWDLFESVPLNTKEMQEAIDAAACLDAVTVPSPLSS